jgi:hypothetical protein
MNIHYVQRDAGAAAAAALRNENLFGFFFR